MLDVNQILKASLITYGIGTQGGVLGALGADCIGFHDDLVTFESGLKDKDACYVGETDDEIVLAFRGTATKHLETETLDWLNNFTAQAIFVPAFPGRVHKGFFQSVLNLWNDDDKGGFVAEVRRRKERSPGKPLCITGYSKGGALTPLAAWLLHTMGIDAETVYIFEPPKCGDARFAKAYDQQFPQTQRYVYQNDIVPQVPPNDEFLELASKIPALKKAFSFFYGKGYTTWDYEPVGQFNFVNWKNKIKQDPHGPIFLDKWLLELAKAPADCLKDHIPCGHLFTVLSDGPCKECRTIPEE